MSILYRLTTSVLTENHPVALARHGHKFARIAPVVGKDAVVYGAGSRGDDEAAGHVARIKQVAILVLRQNKLKSLVDLAM